MKWAGEAKRATSYKQFELFELFSLVRIEMSSASTASVSADNAHILEQQIELARKEAEKMKEMWDDFDMNELSYIREVNPKLMRAYRTFTRLLNVYPTEVVMRAYSRLFYAYYYLHFPAIRSRTTQPQRDNFITQLNMFEEQMRPFILTGEVRDEYGGKGVAVREPYRKGTLGNLRMTVTTYLKNGDEAFDIEMKNYDSIILATRLSRCIQAEITEKCANVMPETTETETEMQTTEVEGTRKSPRTVKRVDYSKMPSEYSGMFT
jgi:hypothetical protein